MHSAFGARWLDLWTGADLAVVKADWARALTGVTAEQYRLAIDAMLERGQQFPPSLPEFVSLTRQFRRHAHAPRLAHARGPAPEGAFQSLRALLAKAPDVPRETNDAPRNEGASA
jgi:hypothetical protein